MKNNVEYPTFMAIWISRFVKCLFMSLSMILVFGLFLLIFKNSAYIIDLRPLLDERIASVFAQSVAFPHP